MTQMYYVVCREYPSIRVSQEIYDGPLRTYCSE